MNRTEERRQQKVNAMIEAAGRLTNAVCRGYVAENWMQAIVSVREAAYEKVRCDQIRSTPAELFWPDEPRLDMRRVRRDRRRKGEKVIRLRPNEGTPQVVLGSDTIKITSGVIEEA